MKKTERNIVFKVSSTRIFKSEGTSPEKETWDETIVLATDAEDAIKRVRDYWNRDDKDDGTIKRRTALVFNSVAQVAVVGIV